MMRKMRFLGKQPYTDPEALAEGVRKVFGPIHVDINDPTTWPEEFEVTVIAHTEEVRDQLYELGFEDMGEFVRL
jgi:hypothetical protein